MSPRQTAHRVIERELGILKRFMDDVLNIAKPKPLQRFPMDVNSSVSEIVDAMRGQGESAGVAVEGRFASEPLVIEGDRFSLGRVYRNLIKNAIQATAAGGRVVVTHRARGRSRRDQRRRHRLRHSAGSALEDLRRLRHDQEPRARPRPGDFEADRRAAWAARSRFRARLDAARRSPCASRRATTCRRRLQQVDAIYLRGWTMVRILVKTEMFAVENARTRCAISS